MKIREEKNETRKKIIIQVVLETLGRVVDLCGELFFKIYYVYYTENCEENQILPFVLISTVSPVFFLVIVLIISHEI